MYISVILPQYTPYKLTYRVPENMRSVIQNGVRVCVVLGKNSVTTAIVSHILTTSEAECFEREMVGKTIKDIVSVIDQTPITTKNQLKLWSWIASYYMCSEGEVMRYFLPNELIIKGASTANSIEYKKSKSLKKERFLSLSISVTDELPKLRGKQKDLLDYFLDIKDSTKVSYSSLVGVGFTSTNVRQAIKNGLLTESYEQIFNEIESCQPIEKTEKSTLTPLLVKSNGREKYIETQIEKIENCILRGETVLILVSEEHEFTLPDRLKEYALFFLSKTTQSKKYKNYCTMLHSGGQIVVGSRAAVGLPFQNLSLIIVTDEHSTNYKSDNSPRFMARDVALMLSHIEHCEIVLESFAPSLDSYYNTTTGKYRFEDNSSIVNCRIIPIDKYSIASRERQVYGNIPQIRYFSKLLLSKIEEAHKTLLFHNRRGYNSFLLCKDCGWVLKCTNCNVSMTYHKEKRHFMCHYCGTTKEPVTICPECSSKNLQLKGIGSENIEESIKRYFPLKSVLRIDSDQLTKKENIIKTINAINNSEANIVVGTWLTIPYTSSTNFNLVGIIDADTIFNVDDFRAEERAFRLINQLARRAENGEMVVQCSNINRDIMKDIVACDYKTMANRELEIRKRFTYPPFIRTTRIYIKHKDETKAYSYAEQLAQEITLRTGIVVSCPNTPIVDKVRSMYIFYITLKFPKNSVSEESKKVIMSIINNKKDSSLQLSIDVDY